MILAFYFFFAFIFKWEPILTLESQEPSVWRYGLEAVLLMILVPLAWTAWKRARLTQEAYRMDRWVIGIWFCMLSFYVIESRLELQGGSRWRPHAPLMLIWTAVFAAKAFGMRRLAAAPENRESRI